MQKSQKQVLLLYISTLGGTLLGLVSSVINTRFLSPVDYGDVRYVQNIITLISSILLLGYFLSGSRLLALSEDESYSRRIRGAMVVVLIAASFILLLSILFCYVIHNNNDIISYLFLIASPISFSCLFTNYINTTAQGDNHIGRLATARLLPTFIYVITAFLVYSNYGANSIKMLILQNGIPSLILLLIIVSTKPSFSNLKPVFKELNIENKVYGFQLYIGSIIMVASNYLAGISLSHFNTDNTQVGFYTLALTVSSPLAFLPSIIGTTFFKQFAKQTRIPTKVFQYTILITSASLLLYVIFIRYIIGILYPESYSQVGYYSSWLAFGFSVHGIGDMMNRFLGSHGKGKEIRNASIANGIFKIFGFIVLVYFFNTIGAIVTQIICSTLYTALMLCYYSTFIKTSTQNKSKS